MPIDEKTIKILEKQTLAGIDRLRTAAQKRFKKLLSLSEKAKDEATRKRYFNQAMMTAKKAEAAIDGLHAMLAQIMYPLPKPSKKARKK